MDQCLLLSNFFLNASLILLIVWYVLLLDEGMLFRSSSLCNIIFWIFGSWVRQCNLKNSKTICCLLHLWSFVWPKHIFHPINHYKWYHHCCFAANKTWTGIAEKYKFGPFHIEQSIICPAVLLHFLIFPAWIA